jgi:hypothetical protein
VREKVATPTDGHIGAGFDSPPLAYWAGIHNCESPPKREQNMLSEIAVRKLLDEKVSDLDKIVAQIEDDNIEITAEIFDVAEQLEDEIRVLQEVLEIKV